MIKLKINDEPKIVNVIGLEDIAKLNPNSMYIMQIDVDTDDELNDFVEKLELFIKERFGDAPTPCFMFTHKHISIAEVVSILEKNSNETPSA